MSRWFSLLVIALAAMALLAACTDGDEGPSAGDASEARAAPVATEDAEPTAEGEQESEPAPTATAEPGPSDEDEGETGTTSADEEYVLSLLEESYDARNAIDTSQMRMVMEMGFGEESLTMNADVAFRQPFDMHMTVEMDVPLGMGSFEMVFTEGRTFMRPAGGKWVEVTADGALPFDFGSILGMAESSEPDFDIYQDLKLQGTEVIDGVEVVHISYSFNAEEATAQAEEILGEDFADLPEVSGSYEDTVMHEWIGKDDKLLRRAELRLGGELEGENYESTMTMDFFDYGEPVDIPSLAEMLEETGG